MGVRRRRKRRVEREVQSGSGQDREALKMMEDILSDFSIDELREFLEADLVDVKVDPEFKERLRKQLWDLVQENARGPRGGSN
jgi:2-hydroxy-3-keto-5-methylthiopentenyl-1-phosphate phosphatase